MQAAASAKSKKKPAPKFRCRFSVFAYMTKPKMMYITKLTTAMPRQ